VSKRRRTSAARGESPTETQPSSPTPLEFGTLAAPSAGASRVVVSVWFTEPSSNDMSTVATAAASNGIGEAQAGGAVQSSKGEGRRVARRASTVRREIRPFFGGFAHRKSEDLWPIGAPLDQSAPRPAAASSMFRPTSAKRSSGPRASPRPSSGACGRPLRNAEDRAVRPLP
jgi:hypothetical protein